MRNVLVVVASLFVACAAGAVDEPAPEPEEESPAPDAGTTSAAAPEVDSGAPAATDQCARAPTVEEFELPDGGHLTVVVVAECRDTPERDLGDPPPR